ncbi:MAG: sarcosine oxidase subunit gamma [Rhizobiaceae bacterium]|nr:sarcosine oxidase subunit gamma [Rhizobiaceae bacterium]
MPYDVSIERLQLFSLFDLKGPRQGLTDWAGDVLNHLPKAPNQLSREDGVELCHTGANRWLLRAEIGMETDLEAKLRLETAPPEISIVKISDTMTFFRVTGEDAIQVMSIGCPLDLHADAFAAQAVSFTEFFNCRALVLRCRGGFDVAVEQSFADMIADYLDRATI